MNKIISLIRQVWSKVRVSKRLYKYGTLGLSVHDDRTRLERLCDKIDSLIPEIKRVIKNTSRWHTFFDVSTGRYISSMQDIRDIEREKGWKYMSFKDIEKENEIQQKANEKKFHERTKRHFRQAFNDIRKGRSFVKEINERIKKGEYEIGQRRTMGHA